MIALFLLSLIVTAQNVEFFKPKITYSDSSQKLFKVRIYGKTLPNSQLILNSTVFPISTNTGYRQYPTTQAVRSANLAQSNSKGLFRFIILLPESTAQIPIMVIFPDKSEKLVQLNIDVTAEKISKPKPESREKLAKQTEAAMQVEKSPKESSNQKTVSENPPSNQTLGQKSTDDENSKQDSVNEDDVVAAIPYSYALSAGLGVNYLRHDQKVDQTQLNFDLSFESFEPPTLYFSFSKQLKSNIKIDLIFNSAPGGVSSSNEITIDQKYNWTIVSLEGTWYLNTEPVNFLGFPSFHGPIFGLQSHTIPFLARSSTSMIDILPNQVTMLFLGYSLKSMGKSWIYQTFLRYQHPVSTGSSFSINSSFTFDGSIGADYQLKDNLQLGVFWYGQSHNYQVSGTDSISSVKTTGPLNLFFSSVELRLTHLF